MTPAPLADIVSPDWATALLPVASTLSGLGQFLRSEVAAGRSFLPRGDLIPAGVHHPPLQSVRVLIVGQDPYPTPVMQWAWRSAVDRRVRRSPLPRSLANIYRELQDDVGRRPPPHGDLSAWSDRGVLLLNRSLTVQPGLPGSHRGRGWEEFTDAAIAALVDRGGPLVAILWGATPSRCGPRCAT